MPRPWGAAGPRVEGRVWILEDPARLRENHDRDDRGRIIRHRWDLIDGPNGEAINYSSGDPARPGERLRYFYDEPGNGPRLADYLSEDAWEKDADGTPVEEADVRGLWVEWKP